MISSGFGGVIVDYGLKTVILGLLCSAFLELNGLMLPGFARDWRKMVDCAFFCAPEFALFGGFMSKVDDVST